MNTVVITIGKKKVGFKFTMLTLQYFSDHTGIEFGDILDELKRKILSSIVILFWSANTVYEEGKNGKVTKFTVDDWISQMSQEELQSVWDCFTESSRNIIANMPKGQEAKKK